MPIFLVEIAIVTRRIRVYENKNRRKFYQIMMNDLKFSEQFAYNGNTFIYEVASFLNQNSVIFNVSAKKLPNSAG